MLIRTMTIFGLVGSLLGSGCDPVDSTEGGAALHNGMPMYGYVGTWMAVSYRGEVVVGVTDYPADLLEQKWSGDTAMTCCVRTGTGAYRVSTTVGPDAFYRDYAVECLPGNGGKCHDQGGGA